MVHAVEESPRLDAPHAKWFIGGQLNVSVNCLDRHIRTGLGNKAAFVWEGEPGDRRTLTYWELYREVNRFANGLKSLGVKRGDRVAIYMPLVPEAAIAMLACARIGAIHSVVFGGFSPDSLRDRIVDAEATVLVTADGGYRRGQIIQLKRNADRAVADCPTIKKVVVLQRLVGAPEGSTPMHAGRDVWWHDVMRDADAVCAPEPMDAEDVLFILYTSGTTGKPKGIRAHDRWLSHGREPRRCVSCSTFDDGRRFLVHGGRRLGDRPFVPGLRPARQRRDMRDVRGRAGLAGQRSDAGRSASAMA